MRLSDVLSKPPKRDYIQVDGFLLNKKGVTGQQVELAVGQVALNYFCSRCEDVRTFYSRGKLCCIFVNEHIVSIDCVLTCGCNTNVQVWFLVECEDDIRNRAPNVRILKRSEKLSSMVKINNERYGKFSAMLDMAERAYRDDLGAGAIVYLRKIFELITMQTANTVGISITGSKGGKKPFKNLLEEVDKKSHIIPREFSANGYKLFGELSDVIHGEYDEELGLSKFEPFYRLVIGILENVRNSQELHNAISSLGWEVTMGGSNDE